MTDERRALFAAIQAMKLFYRLQWEDTLELLHSAADRRRALEARWSRTSSSTT